MVRDERSSAWSDAVSGERALVAVTTSAVHQLPVIFAPLSTRRYTTRARVSRGGTAFNAHAPVPALTSTGGAVVVRRRLQQVRVLDVVVDGVAEKVSGTPQIRISRTDALATLARTVEPHDRAELAPVPAGLAP